MKHTKSSSIIMIAVTSLFFFLSTGAYAKWNCCLSHTVIKACDSSEHFQICKGTGGEPLACSCDDILKKISKAKDAKAARVTSRMAKLLIGVPVWPAWPAATLATTCCTTYEGVSSCDNRNTSGGYLQCKDGSHSLTCTCKRITNHVFEID